MQDVSRGTSLWIFLGAMLENRTRLAELTCDTGMFHVEQSASPLAPGTRADREMFHVEQASHGLASD